MLLAQFFPRESPVAHVIDICYKYGILNDVIEMLSTRKIPSKVIWKKWILKIINDFKFANWRIELKLYKNLQTFRSIVILNTEPCVGGMFVR